MTARGPEVALDQAGEIRRAERRRIANTARELADDWPPQIEAQSAHKVAGWKLALRTLAARLEAE